MKIHWIRILVAAFVLEVVLLVTLVPIQIFIGTQPFLIAVPIGCFVFGALAGMWPLRRLQSGFILHGALIGIVATLIYLGLCAMAPGGILAAAAAYGPAMFVFVNLLRIAGCLAGSYAASRRRAVQRPVFT